MNKPIYQPVSITLEQTEQVIHRLWQSAPDKGSPTVYAILDGARNKKIHPMLRQHVPRSDYACLFEGELDYSLTVAAPYMVRLEEGAAFTRELIQQGWGNSWGVFAITWPPATLVRVRHNCREIAYVMSPENRRLLFRYYDPRVLRMFLSSCDESENLEQIFGPVSHYMVENETATGLHDYTLEKNQGLFKLNDTVIPLFDDKKT